MSYYIVKSTALKVDGTGAHDLLQQCFTNDLNACIGKSRSPIRPGRCVYGAFLSKNGGVIDDILIYMLSDGQYMAVVNAGMGPDIALHLENHLGQHDTTITNMADRLGKIDIQGPLSAQILSNVLVDAEKAFDTLPYFSFKGHFDTHFPFGKAVCLKNGTTVLLSRTGYTGEFGFELFMPADQAVAVWEAIVEAGDPIGLIACGLAARDSLRSGAVLPLSHQDIGPWPFINTPWSFALPFAADGRHFTKSFIGDKALLEWENPEYTHAFVGKDLRKVATKDPAIVIDKNGNEIGTVLTCVSDMGIGYVDGKIYSIASPDKPEGFKPRGLCCGFIKVKNRLNTDEVVQFILCEIDKARKKGAFPL